MRKNGFRLSSMLSLTVALCAFGSLARAQEPASDYTPTSAPPLATTTTPTETATPAAGAPVGEVERPQTTMDRVDQDRWTFPNRPLVITGSAVLVSAYVPAVIAGAVSDDISNKAYYPVAGPWMEIAQESNTETWTALLAIDGVFQGLGALALVSGFVIPERKTRNWYLIGDNRLMVTPRMTHRSVGVGAFARF